MLDLLKFNLVFQKVSEQDSLGKNELSKKIHELLSDRMPGNDV